MECQSESELLFTQEGTDVLCHKKVKRRSIFEVKLLIFAKLNNKQEMITLTRCSDGLLVLVLMSPGLKFDGTTDSVDQYFINSVNHYFMKFFMREQLFLNEPEVILSVRLHTNQNSSAPHMAVCEHIKRR